MHPPDDAQVFRLQTESHLIALRRSVRHQCSQKQTHSPGISNGKTQPLLGGKLRA